MESRKWVVPLTATMPLFGPALYLLLRPSIAVASGPGDAVVEEVN